jgi:hypothetical protein
MGPISQERSFSHCSEKTLDRSGFLASISSETFMIADSAVVYKPKPDMHDDRLGVNFGASDPRAHGHAVPEQPPF